MRQHYSRSNNQLWKAKRVVLMYKLVYENSTMKKSNMSVLFFFSEGGGGLLAKITVVLTLLMMWPLRHCIHWWHFIPSPRFPLVWMFVPLFSLPFHCRDAVLPKLQRRRNVGRKTERPKQPYDGLTPSKGRPGRERRQTRAWPPPGTVCDVGQGAPWKNLS